MGVQVALCQAQRKEAVKIATFNVNGVNGRLPVLLRWLEETSPDIVCLQELKSETFPQSAVVQRRLGGDRPSACGGLYEATHVERLERDRKLDTGSAILTRSKGVVETRRALPGDR